MNEDHYELCLNIIELLRQHEYYQYFQSPAITAIPPEQQDEYLQLISKPMDIETVSTNLAEGKYSGIAAFREDINLCFENSKKFCKTRYPSIYEIAVTIQKYFRNQMEKAMNNLSKKSKSSSSSSSSNSSNNKNKIDNNSNNSNTKSSNKRNSEAIKLPPEPIEIEPIFRDDSLISRCEKIVNDTMNLNDCTKMLHGPIDLTAYPDYLNCVEYPMYFNLILDRIHGKAKEEPKKYSTFNQLALDIRRIFGNFIRYNYVTSSAKFRKQAIAALLKFEQKWRDIMVTIKSTTSYVKLIQPLPEVIPCLEAIDDTLKTPSSLGKGEYSIDGFMYPVRHILKGDIWKQYNETISKPMDYSTIISKLIEAGYKHIDELKEDVRLVSSNCQIYWSIYGGEAEKSYIVNAALLEETFMKSLDERLKKTPPQSLFPPIADITPITEITSSATLPSTKSTKPRPSLSAALASLSSLDPNLIVPSIPSTSSSIPILKRQSSTASTTPVSIASPSTQTVVKEESAASIQRRATKYLQELFRKAIAEVKNHYLMSTTIDNFKVVTARPFLKAVDPVLFSDYHLIVTNPMDLTKMEKKVAGNRYESISAILSDMKLIRDNAYAYNTDKDSIEVPIMADALLDYFKHLMRSAVQDLYLSMDDRLADAIVTDDVKVLLQQPDAETVTKYLNYVEAETGTKPRFTVTLSNKTNTVTSLAAITSSSSSSSSSSTSSTKQNKNRESTNSNSNNNNISNIGVWDTNSSIIGQPGFDDSLDLSYSNDDSSSVVMIQKTTSRGGKGSKGDKSSRNSSSSSSGLLLGLGFQGPMVSILPTVVRDKTPWELACEKMLNTLCKHPYIERVSTSLVANFFVPVTEVYPSLAEEYLKVISNPMDLTTLRMRLDNFSILDAEEFYNMAVSIFQNALDYSVYQENQATAQGLIQGQGEELFYKYRNFKYKHLIQYTKWLGLEMPPEALTNDIGKEHPEKLGNLRLSLQELARKEREMKLKEIVIDRNATSSASGISECDKLLKAIKRTANNTEKQQIEFFTLPVDETLLADYIVYVRKPMDLATVKFKLDGTLPMLGTKTDQVAVLNKIRHTKSHINFGEFIDDLRRIFDNAIKYNGPHRETDTTGFSQRVYDAAIFLKERLERLLPDFTLTLLDKLERHRLRREEDYERDSRKRSRAEQVEINAAQFEAETIQKKKKLLAEDEYYAADMDLERKKALTKQQMIASRIAKKQRLEEMSMSKMGYVDDDLLDADAMDIDSGGSFTNTTKSVMTQEGYVIGPDGSKLTAYEAQVLEERRLLTIKEQLRIPMPMVRLLEMKKKLREAVWKKWEPYAITKPRVVVKPNTITTTSSSSSMNQSTVTLTDTKVDYGVNDSSNESSQWISVDIGVSTNVNTNSTQSASESMISSNHIKPIPLSRRLFKQSVQNRSKTIENIFTIDISE